MKFPQSIHLLFLTAYCLTALAQGGPNQPASTAMIGGGRMLALQDLARAEAASSPSVLPSGTAVYLLNHVETPFRDAEGNPVIMFYGVTDDGTEGRDIRNGNHVWIPFSTADLDAHLFEGTLPGLFLEPTRDPAGATYLYTTENIPVLQDNQWWIDFLSQSGLNEDDCYSHAYSDQIPFTRRSSEPEATDADRGCFESGEIPQQKNGQPCPSRGEALQFSPAFRSILESAAAQHENLDAATLATALHLETGNLNPFHDNEWERNDCMQRDPSGNCDDYGWGRGLGQFGRNVAEQYNLDWSNQNGSFTSSCTDVAVSESCLRDLQNRCDEIESRGERVPVSCPRQSIEAMARHLSDALSDEIPVWTQTGSGTRLANLAPVLARNPREYTRALLAAYNRGPRVINSYVEFFNQNGRWPESFGEAWTTPRQLEEFEGIIPPPHRNFGFQMLTNEFVNRCHMWAATGMCGEFREGSLIDQYGRQFR